MSARCITQSVLPPGTVEAVAGSTASVGRALRYTTSVVDSGRDSDSPYVFGYDTSRRTGRAPGDRSVRTRRGPGGGRRSGGRRAGVDLGDEVNVLGHRSRSAGCPGQQHRQHHGVPAHRDYAAIRGDATAYLLVGAAPGVEADQLVARIDDGAGRDCRPGTVSPPEANVVRDRRRDGRDDGDRQAIALAVDRPDPVLRRPCRKLRRWHHEGVGRGRAVWRRGPGSNRLVRGAGTVGRPRVSLARLDPRSPRAHAERPHRPRDGPCWRRSSGPQW